MHPSRPQRLVGLASGWPGACVLLLGFAALALSSARGKSHTFDELAHVAAGYSYWAFDDYRLNPENGNLPQRLAGLPAWLMGARAPDLAQSGWDRADVWSFGNALLFRSGNDTERLVFAGRAMTVAIAVLLGLLIYATSRQLFGRPGGMLSLWLYALSPTVLAHSRLMTSDLIAAGFFLAATVAFWRLLQLLTWPRLATSSLALAGLFLSKSSALLALPVLALIGLTQLLRDAPLPLQFRGRRWTIAPQGRRALVIVLVALIHAGVVVTAIWGSVGWRYSAFNGPTAQQAQFYDPTIPTWQGAGLTGGIVSALRRAELLPESYLFGISFVVHHAEQRAGFLAGRWSDEGWWWYFPYAVLIKTATGSLLLFAAAALGLLLLMRRSRRRRPTDMTPNADGEHPELWSGVAALALLLLVYWLVLLGSALNIGHRHSLPIYPPLFVLAGVLGRWLVAGVRWQKVAIVLVALTVAAESFAVAPNYLAYFNLLVGGPAQGWKHLVDSSLDWGQDLPALKRWLEQTRAGRAGPVYLSYFGTSHPSFYGIAARRLPGHVDFDRKAQLHRIEAGTYCISATMLQAVYLGPASGPWTRRKEQAYQDLHRQLPTVRQLEPSEQRRVLALADTFRFARLVAFLRRLSPTTTINYSILVYRLSQAQAQQALHGPPPYD